MRPRDQRDLAKILLRKAAQNQLALAILMDKPNLDDAIVGFHAQQAIEKSLKAVLAALDVRYEYTHDSERLIEYLAEAGVPVPDWLTQVHAFDIYAVLPRYDEMPSPESLDRRLALNLVERVRGWVEEELERA